jgi:hypothetical protein
MRMSTSSKSSRFPAQFIPSFLALDQVEQPAVENPANPTEAAAQIPVIARRLQVDARLEIVPQENSDCQFILHSRMNARILTGTLGRSLASTQEQAQEVRRLLLLCTQETSFELKPLDKGFVWRLRDVGTAVQGQSDKIGDEALARATLRLITGQAARALRTLDLVL